MSETTAYQVCSRCVMDTTDPLISFNEKGECSHCQRFDNFMAKIWFPNEEGERRLKKEYEQIKIEGKGKEYDCIIGLSGGVDSSFLAYHAVQNGLRPLILHIDTGWNSELAQKNVENIVKKLNLDLFTHVVRWNEMRDVQAAFFRSGIANLDVPQDHAIFAGLYDFAAKNNIRYVINGFNVATESVMPSAWGHGAIDLRNLTAIHKTYGKIKLKEFPRMRFLTYYIYYPFIKRMKIISPLNLMPYNKQAAIKVLEKELDWKYYGGKHFESRFTKFFQSYYLPTRYGYDKRKAHLASLVLAGEMSRQDALEELKGPPYNPESIEEDKALFLKKLKLTEEEFEEVMTKPPVSYRDFPNNYWIIRLKSILFDALRKVIARNYSATN